MVDLAFSWRFGILHIMNGLVGWSRLREKRSVAFVLCFLLTSPLAGRYFCVLQETIGDIDELFGLSVRS